MRKVMSTKNTNQFIKKQGDKWVIKNKAGKILSHHDTLAKAQASFRTIEANKHGGFKK